MCKNHCQWKFVQDHSRLLKFFCSIQLISLSRSKFAICFLFKWSATYWKWQQRWRPFNSWQENIWIETHTFISWAKVEANKTGSQNSSHISLIFQCTIKCYRMLKKIYCIFLNSILSWIVSSLKNIPLFLVIFFPPLICISILRCQKMGKSGSE